LIVASIRSRRNTSIWILVAIGFVVVLATALSLLPVQDWLLLAGGGLQSFGLLGVVLFGAIYVCGAMLLVPASALSLASGLLYGPFGIVLSWAAMMVVAAISFPLARHSLKMPVRHFVEKRPRARTIADVIDEEGWRMVLLVRVSGFIPFGLQNYVLGVTNIPFGPFLFASSLGFLPSILVYAGAGAFGSAALNGAGHRPLHFALLALAILAGLALVGTTARKVHSRLRQQAALNGPRVRA
jgi:uncharacterized membrane protein YdjX (TVP38/TMEM64 family)